MERRSRTNLTPALVASGLLHAGIAALALLTWQKAAKKVEMGPVVPVTIVNGPPADLKQAAQADKPQEAQTPEPDASAPDQQPSPPAPEPTPAPPQPAPKPAPPEPAPPKPAPPKLAPPKPAPSKPTPPKPAPTPKPTPPQPQPKPAPKPPPPPKPAPPKPAPPKPAPPKPTPKPAPPKPAPPKPAPPKPAPPKPAPPKPAPPRPAPQPRPAPAPKPSPPKPAPRPQARPAPPSPAPKAPPGKSASANPAPARAAPAQARPRQTLDLDALSASLSGMVTKRGAAPSSAARGAARPAAELQPVQGSGVAKTLSATDRVALASKLGKLWNPNCEVAGASNVTIKMHIQLSADGRLARAPEVAGSAGADRSVLDAAEILARSAVRRGEPYSDLSPGPKDIIFTFNTKQACANR